MTKAALELQPTAFNLKTARLLPHFAKHLMLCLSLKLAFQQVLPQVMLLLHCPMTIRWEMIV